MDYQIIQVKMAVCDPSTQAVVDVPIPREIWDSKVDELEDCVKESIGNSFDEDLDFSGSTGYIDNEGYSHDCTPSQTLVAFHLLSYGVTVANILRDCSSLETLRDAMVKELETNQPEKKEQIQALKNITDFKKAMFCASDYDYYDDDEWDNDNQVCLIYCEYPLNLLDELARRINNVSNQ